MYFSATECNKDSASSPRRMGLGASSSEYDGGNGGGGGTSSNESASPSGSSVGQNSNPPPSNSQQQQQQQQQQMTISMTNGVNSVLSSLGGPHPPPPQQQHPQALPPCRMSVGGAAGGPSGPHRPMAIEQPPSSHGYHHHTQQHHPNGPHPHRHPHPGAHPSRMGAHGHGPPPEVHGGGPPERPFLVNLTQFPTTGGLIILNGKSAGRNQGPCVQQGPTGPQMHHPGQHHHHMGPQTGAVSNMNSTTRNSMMDIRNSNMDTSHGGSAPQQVFMHSQPYAHRPPHPQMTHQHHPHMSATPPTVAHAPPNHPHTGGHPSNGSTSDGTSSTSVPVTSATNTSSTTSTPAGTSVAGGNPGQPQQQASGYFGQETLEMSHEDIQRTLSANMAIPDHAAVDLVPMSPNADDVFVNLDAFDILADLSSEDLDPNHHHDKNTIVDINPEWANSEGGTKILIVGQFNNPNWDYSVHFGDLAAPAVYLQTGVLKCFCPPHSPGLVPIRVYSNGKQISVNSMVFEYKADQRSSPVPVPPSETSMKLCLIHRMECLEKCFRNFKTDVHGSRTLEESMVKICCEMINTDWDGRDPNGFLTRCDRGITLLHAAAALGYSKLMLTLIQGKREKPSSVIEQEINSMRPDDFGSIPLMWAVRNGQFESSRILASWAPESVARQEGQSGLTSIEIAAGAGYAKLACELEKIGKTATNTTSDRRLLATGSSDSSGRGAATNSNSLTTAGGTSHLVNVVGSGGIKLELGTTTEGLHDHNNRVNNMGSCDRVKIGGMRSQRSSSVLSDDFGLKDCFFGQPDTGLVELAVPSEEESRVLKLAEQIIAAMPERIKEESKEEFSPSDSQDSGSVLSNPHHSDDNDLTFDFTDRSYRYYESGTPCSSLSPSSSCLQSPCSSSFAVDSPQPTTAELSEFLQASAFERDFSNLTLSEREQRELYEAAKVIQKAFRSYKGSSKKRIRKRRRRVSFKTIIADTSSTRT